MPVWLDRVLPTPANVSVVLAIRRHAVGLGIGLGLAKVLSGWSMLVGSKGSLVLGAGVIVAVGVVMLQVKAVWQDHQHELGSNSHECETEASAKSVDGDGDRTTSSAAGTGAGQLASSMSSGANGKLVYDGRLRLLLPSVSRAAEKALMATVEKVKALPKKAAMTSVMGAVKEAALSSMQGYARDYVFGKEKGE